MNARSDLDDLKSRVNLAELVRQSGLELKQVGKNLMGKCPFHDDSTASLSVNGQLWNCFGCEAGGDVFDWLRLREKLDFPQAKQRLLELQGAQPERVPFKKKPPRPELHQVEMRRAVEIYQRSLLQSKEAQAYLAQRGLESRELWNSFRVGYVDGSLLDLVPRQGPVWEALLDSGLVHANGKEHFHGCIVVPLEHPEQGTVALYGRKIDAADPVPHLYLPGPKRGVLNLQSLSHFSSLVLTESVLDALSLWEAGCRNVTALCGCQMTSDVASALVACQELVFCLDADEAGRKAQERLAKTWSNKTLSAVILPDHTDPNQILVERGPAALKKLVERASPLQLAEKVGCVEKLSDGFLMRLGDLEYQVTPQPPFQAKLRVLLKVRSSNGRFSDQVDLLSSRACQMVLSALSRRLSRPKSELEEHFALLTSEAEAWAEAQQAVDLMGTIKPPELTAAEREEALAFLSQPDLVQVIWKDMETLGYVGEEKPKLLAYLIGLSRKLKNPLSGIVISQAGAGKSGLTELVEQLTPREDVVLFSRLSSQALYYMPRDYLKRKLLLLEERVGAEAAEYSIRVLQSRQHLSQAVVIKDPSTGQMSTRRFDVEGPIAYLETTTSHRINYENATRCFELTLDESQEQTQRIHERQRLSRTLEGLLLDINQEQVRRRHHNAQRLLEEVRVVIPYVHQLDFPKRWLRTRRDNERFLSLIEAVAFLHQKQRVQGRLPDGTAYIEATWEDYKLAFELAQDVLAATFHELSRGGRELLDTALELQERSKEPGLFSFTRREVRQALDWPNLRVQEAINELVELEYLGVLAGSQGKAYRYRLLEAPEQGTRLLHSLTTPQQLAQLLRLSPTSKPKFNGVVVATGGK